MVVKRNESSQNRCPTAARLRRSSNSIIRLKHDFAAKIFDDAR